MIRPFLLVFCIFTSCLVAEQPPKYALLGETVSLDPAEITVQPDDILWKHKGDKVVEFDGNEQNAYGTFDNRITLDWHSAKLTISDLRYEDSGVYVLEAFAKKELKRASFTLEVMDGVAKPTISCKMNNGNSSIESGNQATLTCSTEASQSPSLPKFEWSSHGIAQIGEKLIIPLGDEHDDKVYDCTVSNPLTKNSAIFTAKECYPDGGSAGLTAGICVAIIAVISLIILGVLFCKLKQKVCFAKEKGHDVENPPAKTKGSENKAAQEEERRSLIHRESTLASKQPLRFLTQQDINSQNDDTEDSDQDDKHVPVKERIERIEQKTGKKKAPGLEKNQQIRAASPHPLDSAQNDKGDPDVHSVKELLEEERDPSDSQEADDVSGNKSENKNSDLQPNTASEQPEAKKEADEETESPENGVPAHAAEPHVPVTEDSQNQSPEDDAGEHEDQTVSDQQDQDTTENYVKKGDSSEEEEEKQSEDLNKKTPEHHMDSPAETPINVRAMINAYEQHNVNQNTKGLEEEKQIPVVSSGPLDSAGNDKDPDVHTFQERPEDERDPSDSEKSDDVLGDESENVKSVLQPPTASEQPGSEEDKQIPAVSPGPQDSAENNKGDPDVHSSQELPEDEHDPSDSEKSDDVSGDKSENKKSDLQPSTASDQTVKQEEDAGDDAALPVDHPVSPLTQDSSTLAPQDGAGKQEKDSSSDQVTGETTDLRLDGSDLSSKAENESNNHNDVKDNSSISDPAAAGTTHEQNSEQEETRQGDDKQQESDNSEDNHDSDSENEREKIDQNLPPEPPQSPITPKPDNNKTSTSPVTEHTVPDEKEKNKSRQNRGSDSSMEEAGKGEAAED